jgi:hypothetical protein
MASLPSGNDTNNGRAALRQNGWKKHQTEEGQEVHNNN